MSSRLALVMLFAVLACDDPGEMYDCQPLCTYQNGGVIGGKITYTVAAKSETAAQQMCLADAANDAMPSCDPGGVVNSCSCVRE